MLLSSKEYLFMSFCPQERAILEALNTSEHCIGGSVGTIH